MSVRVLSILEMDILFIKHIITLQLAEGEWVEFLLPSFLCLSKKLLSIMCHTWQKALKTANRSPPTAHVLDQMAMNNAHRKHLNSMINFTWKIRDRDRSSELERVVR